jgi:FkbM family methyltransferase
VAPIRGQDTGFNYMNINRSLKGFVQAWREDAAFRALGRPLGWSVLIRYLGRWHDRRGTVMSPEKVAFTYRGRRIEFELNDSYLGAFKGVFIDEEYDCTPVLRQGPGRILDLGGNIGFGSVFFAQLFPQAAFAIVEPDPRNLPLLRRNLETNRVQAMIVDGAIGPAAGRFRLRLGKDPACSSLDGTGLHELSESVDVRVATVPEILEKSGWDRIDLIKIDIEGAEEDLLSRDNGWLARVGAILIEVHPNTTVERLNSHLAPYGFKLERFGAGREPVYWAAKQRA